MVAKGSAAASQPHAEIKTTTATKKKARKPLDKGAISTYQKVKEQQPEAFVFIANNGRFDLVGEQAKELCERYDIDLITEANDKDVFSIDIDQLDTIARALVDSGNVVKIIENMAEMSKEDNFIDGTDKIAELEMAVLPDYSITQEDMDDYGYKWLGMLPLRRLAAVRLKELGFEVFKLYENDTEGAVESVDEIRQSDGVIFGVEKPTWKAFYESEEGKAYLAARSSLCEAGSYVASEDMSYVDAKFIEPFIDNNFSEKHGLREFFKTVEKPPVEKQK